MTADDDLRYEVKLVCRESKRDRVLTALGLCPLGVRRLHPPRCVQSLYFDTPGGRALAENLDGISARTKLRFRWYGPASERVRGALERKHRVNNLGTKDVLTIDRELAVAGVRRVDFRAELMAACEGRWREELGRGLEVVQWIAYDRQYLTTGDRRVRVTVDENLRAADQRHRQDLSDRHATPLPRVLVLEFKAPVEHRDTVEELLQYLPVKADKCSKFVLASDPAHGPLL